VDERPPACCLFCFEIAFNDHGNAKFFFLRRRETYLCITASKSDALSGNCLEIIISRFEMKRRRSCFCNSCGCCDLLCKSFSSHEGNARLLSFFPIYHIILKEKFNSYFLINPRTIIHSGGVSGAYEETVAIILYSGTLLVWLVG
jgi:hypothetical protein